MTGGDIGGYLTKLESEYRLIAKNVPFASNGHNRNMRYVLNDNFYRFWFRFICKYQALIELRAYGRLRETILRDLAAKWLVANAKIHYTGEEEAEIDGEVVEESAEPIAEAAEEVVEEAPAEVAEAAEEPAEPAEAEEA